MLIYDILIFAGAIALLVIVLQLRQFLARIYPAITARVVDTTAPLSLADLYGSAHNELTALGLEGPVWLLLDYEPEEAGMFRLCAVYRHTDDGLLAWLFPPADLNSPNRLLTHWSTTLSDGRTIISQAFDRYFESLATPAFPAQTIHGKTLDEQIDQHRQYRAGFSESTDPSSLQNEGIIGLASRSMNQQRDALVEQQRFWRDSKGVVRARLGMAIRMMMLFWRRKQPGDPAVEVPAAQLVLFARLMERMRQMEPGMKVQLGLFAASVALSVGLGALIWDLQFAVIILLVIIFHELGHYLAMRAFGYRNVHMLALPLVGGVTLGLDAEPSAVKRAWMSLMGPLPGIIVGWILLYFAFTSGFEAGINSWLSITAIILLFVNYLNIIPMLPLDGGHVVQALLPPRWVNLQAAILAITCVIGIIAAVTFDLYILAFLAGIQLFTLGNHFQTGRAIRRLLDQGMPSQRRGDRLLNIFRVLEEIAGPTNKVPARINQAEQILQTLDTKPMSWRQRSVVGTVYTALLIVPVIAGLFALGFFWSSPKTDGMTERFNQMKIERAELVEQAKGMTLKALLKDIQAEVTIDQRSVPATEEAISATEQRLGRALPDELHAFYRLADGVPSLGITKLEEIEWAATTFSRLKQQQAIEEIIHLSTAGENGTTSIELSLKQAGQWLTLSQPDTEDFLILLDPNNPPTLPEMRVFNYSNGWAAGYPTLHAKLEEQWVLLKSSQQESAYRHQRTQQALEKLSDASQPQLVEQFQPPTLFLTLLNPQLAWPDGADEETIVSAEKRLGHRLASDLRELYLLHDGFPPLQILSLQAMTEALPKSDKLIASLFSNGQTIALPDSNNEPIPLNAEMLSGCIVIGGVKIPTADTTETTLYPILAWCPQPPLTNQYYIQLSRAQSYSTLTDYLKQSAAERM